MDEQPQAPENQNPAPEPQNVNPAPAPEPAAAPAPPQAEQSATDAAPAPVETPPQPEQKAEAVSGTPATWPGAFGLYKYSKAAVKFNLAVVVMLWIINLLIGSGGEFILRRSGGLVSWVFGSFITAALIKTYMAGIRGQKLELGDAFSQALPQWLKMIGLNLLVGLSVFASLLLLIIPFFFVFPRLLLAQYFLVDKNMGVMDAYKASWNATKGNVSKVWGIVGANLVMALLMITIIGIPFSIYFLLMYSAASGLLYELIQKSQPAAPAV